jgi:AraC-like DNA-binding protein
MRSAAHLPKDPMPHKSSVKIWRMADLHDAEMLKGAYVRHAYPWHSHEEISLGLVVGGAIELRTRTHQGVARTGSFVLVNAEQAHQGTPATPEGWRCRTIHLNPEIVQSTASELKGHGRAFGVRFRGPTFEDPDAARDLLQLHIASESPGSALERQSRMIVLIARLLLRHSDSSITLPRASGECDAIRRARDFLDENLANKVSLDSLAVVAEIPSFRLLRAFQQELGLSPHAYQIQARIRASNRMLRQGAALADIAGATGFADQAHLTRVFKTIMGVTPGQYRAAF